MPSAEQIASHLFWMNIHNMAVVAEARQKMVWNWHRGADWTWSPLK
jgi:hypothetical protein